MAGSFFFFAMPLTVLTCGIYVHDKDKTEALLPTLEWKIDGVRLAVVPRHSLSNVAG